MQSLHPSRVGVSSKCCNTSNTIMCLGFTLLAHTCHKWQNRCTSAVRDAVFVGFIACVLLGLKMVCNEMSALGVFACLSSSLTLFGGPLKRFLYSCVMWQVWTHLYLLLVIHRTSICGVPKEKQLIFTISK